MRFTPKIKGNLIKFSNTLNSKHFFKTPNPASPFTALFLSVKEEIFIGNVKGKYVLEIENETKTEFL